MRREPRLSPVRRARRALSILIAASISMPLVSCAGRRPTDLGVAEGRLPACPASPNCVSSDAPPGDATHAVSALELSAAPDAAWRAAREAVAALPRTTIVTDSDHYLHAECQSALLGFVDDLELNLRPAEGVIAVRSASRLGYGDMGVNRRRVEFLRSTLAERKVVRSSH